MARQRKTFVSDAYAKRQAAFAKLGVGKIVNPLQRFRRTLQDAHAALARAMQVFPVDSPEVRVASKEYQKARLFHDHASFYAERGDGAALQRFALRQFA
jgi:hypothetical protein